MKPFLITKLYQFSFAIVLAFGFPNGIQVKDGDDRPRVPRSLLLFNGRDLSGWKETKFTGAGEVRIEDGKIILGHGYMTGINWVDADSLPKSNYEVHVEASRINGSDFFCALTFPIGNTNSTLVVGGWGGGVVGVSSIDGFDASENETTTYHRFEPGRFYRIRLKVTDAELQAWIDDEQVVDVEREGRKFGMRFGDIELSVPLGVASWSTTAAIRKIELRVLEPEKKSPDQDP